MKKYFVLTALLAVTAISLAQSTLPIPRDMLHAFKNGTRSYSGKPGPNYWVNSTDYQIRVSIDPQTHRLAGRANLVYHNQSPDTLNEIVFRSYADIFRYGTSRDWPVDSSDVGNTMRVESITVNDSAVAVSGENSRLRRRGTNMTLILPHRLAPHANLNLSIAWHFTFPFKTHLRMGAYDSTSFFVGYWYPQIAVYDDVNGWDHYNYGGLVEFYNDCNNFDVRISVPKNMVVWATGVLQNPKQLLPATVYERYERALTSDAIVHVLDSTEVADRVFEINPSAHHWHFKANKVPDFAFALSDHYLWDMVSVTVDPKTERRTTIHAAYKAASADFYEVAQIARAALDYYSKELPAVPFPYPELTVFNGGGGMEYPMMVNDGSSSRHAGTVHVTTHEIAHSYFPFYMGINERKYAWMDEGWATMLPFELQHRLEPAYDPVKRAVGRYTAAAGSEMDIPPRVPTIVYGPNAYVPAYRNAAYSRSGVAYLMLQKTLGKTKFRKALRAYIGRWHGKHPLPTDFFFTINEVAGEDLSWFWKPWFFDFGYPDLRLKEVAQKDGLWRFTVEKIGALPVPVELTVTTADSQTVTIEAGAAVWKDGKTERILRKKIDGGVLRAELESEHIPDVNPKDNVWEPGDDR